MVVAVVWAQDEQVYSGKYLGKMNSYHHQVHTNTVLFPSSPHCCWVSPSFYSIRDRTRCTMLPKSV